MIAVMATLLPSGFNMDHLDQYLRDKSEHDLSCRITLVRMIEKLEKKVEYLERRLDNTESLVVDLIKANRKDNK